MFRERLIPYGFLTQLHCPPMIYQERALKELYLDLSDRFQYRKFELLSPGQGAILREGEARSCEIYRDRMVVKEQPTALAFEDYLDQLQPIVESVQRALRIPVWIVQQAVLRFLVPMDVPAAPLVRSQLFNLPDEVLGRFGRPVLGLCLRIEFPPLPDEPTQMQLRVEPYFKTADANTLFIELSTRFLQPLQTAEELRPRLSRADEFVKDKALAFLEETLSPRSS